MHAVPRVAAAASALACSAAVLVMTTTTAHGSGPESTWSCRATVTGVTGKGVPATFRYDHGAASTQLRGPGRLGYQPRDVAHPHRTESGTSGLPSTSYWFTVSGSQLREVTEVDHRNATGRLVADYHTRVVRKHWEGARQIAIGRARAFLYVLSNDDQLLRYKLRGKPGQARVGSVQLVGTGFGSIGTFEYARSINALGLRTDVFLATNADSGALLEYAIPKDDPASYSVRVLADTGWWDMRVAGRSASCVDSKSGETYGAIVGVGIDGAVRLWTDAAPADSDGSDILPWGELAPTWKPLAYSD